MYQVSPTSLLFHTVWTLIKFKCLLHSKHWFLGEYCTTGIFGLSKRDRANNPKIKPFLFPFLWKRCTILHRSYQNELQLQDNYLWRSSRSCNAWSTVWLYVYTNNYKASLNRCSWTQIRRKEEETDDLAWIGATATALEERRYLWTWADEEAGATGKEGNASQEPAQQFRVALAVRAQHTALYCWLPPAEGNDTHTSLCYT